MSNKDEMYVDTNALTQNATQLKKIVQEMTDEFSSVINKISELDNTWDGKASNNALTSFEELKDYIIKEKSKRFNKSIKALDSVVVGGDEDTENSNKSLSDTFL